MGVVLKKLLNRYFFCICILLLIIAFMAGCTGVKTTSASPVPGLVTVIITPQTNTPDVSMTHIGHVPTLSYAYANEKCPIPPLVFNNSQDFTTLHTGFTLVDSAKNPITEAGGYPIPEGSIIYHGPDFISRIFDSKGNQMMIVNDSESSVRTPAGYQGATLYFYHYSDNFTTIGGGERIQFDIDENDQNHPCKLIVIYGSNYEPPFTPSHEYLPH